MDTPETSTESGPPATRRRNRPASASGPVVDIAGLSLEVQGTRGAHRQVLEALFEGVPRSGRPADARLEFGRRPVRLPDRAPDEDYQEFLVWHEGDVLFVSSLHHELRVRVDTTVARISCPSPDNELGLRQAFPHVATHLLLNQDAYVVHGGAFACDDVTVLALGYSGAGKSTLALAALEHGWRVLSDDLVVLRRDDGIGIQGVPKPLALPGDLGATVVDDAPTLEWDHRRRRHVPVERMDTAPGRLDEVVIVGHADGPTSQIEPATTDEVVPLLLSSFAATGDPAMLRRFFPVAMTVARLRCRHLRHSNDSAARVGEAARALDELRAG